MSGHDVHIYVYTIDTDGHVVLSCPDCPAELRVTATPPEMARELATMAALWHEGRILNGEGVRA